MEQRRRQRIAAACRGERPGQRGDTAGYASLAAAFRLTSLQRSKQPLRILGEDDARARASCTRHKVLTYPRTTARRKTHRHGEETLETLSSANLCAVAKRVLKAAG